MQAARDTDPVRQERTILFDAWLEDLKTERSFTAADLVAEAEAIYSSSCDGYVNPRIHAFLLETCAGKSSRIEPRAVDKLLKRHENTVVRGLKLTAIYADRRRPRFRLTSR
jgi:hypothetical protein